MSEPSRRTRTPLHPTVARTAERYVAWFDRLVPARWHPLIGDALAHWRRTPGRSRMPPRQCRQQTAEFVLHVIAAAHRLSSTPSP